MGFFKDFKDDLTQAVNEMLPGAKNNDDLIEETASEAPLEELQENTVPQDVDVAEEIVKLNDVLGDENENTDQNHFLEIEEVEQDAAESQMSDADAFHEAVKAFESEEYTETVLPFANEKTINEENITNSNFNRILNLKNKANDSIPQRNR